MAIWWVNLGLQFAAQRDSSTLWCPGKRIRKDGSLGKPFWHWANIADVKKGEFIVLCKSAQILGLAYSTATARPDQPKPNGFPVGGRWHDTGWRLPVEFLLFDTPKDRNELTRGLFQRRNKRRPLLNDPKTGKGRGTQIYRKREFRCAF
ncbi:hypothetical protein FHX09_004313 [Rhizobium sp. BK538]|nr:hypothetical protein [Rhizobium sp. BK538]